MVVQVHGFDWGVYTERIMPAFEQWLIQRDEEIIYRLFKETRCAREESFIPAPLQRSRIWPRAKAFAETLPLGPYSRREYQKLCSAEHFTALSDRYMYKHAPQLYQNPEPIRAVWGALIETYCLSWSSRPPDFTQKQSELELDAEDEEYLTRKDKAQIERNEVLALLREAGLNELAHEMSEQVRLLSTERLSQESSSSEPHTQPLTAERTPWEPGEVDFTSLDKDEDELEEEDEEIEEYTRPMPGGIAIGSHPNTLQMRGWLASLSTRAMALFEYLTCGRRCMPFGYEPSEPYGVFIGYLTADEVWRLGTSLRGAPDPDQAEAEADYLRFRYQHPGLPESYRLVDEVLPTHASEFHRAVDMAAAQGLGLICSIE
ncbi:MAG TPA: hypothetical protein VFN35_32715 [Ktedonobacteraceae bacterium]|nr:hypothetical protein [Ktedonobacteraceae bacterium]